MWEREGRNLQGRLEGLCGDGWPSEGNIERGEEVRTNVDWMLVGIRACKTLFAWSDGEIWQVVCV